MPDERDRPGGWSAEGLSATPAEPDTVEELDEALTREYRDPAATASGTTAQERPDHVDEEAPERNEPVAEVAGTTGLPAGIGDTGFPAGIVADEDADSSGGASDVEQGW